MSNNIKSKKYERHLETLILYRIASALKYLDCSPEAVLCEGPIIPCGMIRIMDPDAFEVIDRDANWDMFHAYSSIDPKRVNKAIKYFNKRFGKKYD